jgi:hypothetical protein
MSLFKPSQTLIRVNIGIVTEWVVDHPNNAICMLFCYTLRQFRHRGSVGGNLTLTIIWLEQRGPLYSTKAIFLGKYQYNITIYIGCNYIL